jgi:16S rRNA (guanine527-N7)-methyltransferase
MSFIGEFMEYHTKQFEQTLTQMHLPVSDEMIGKFLHYYEMLVETNKVMNLTAITEFDEVLEKHFIDSLLLGNVVDLEREGNLRLLDLGTGAGFPGVPLKIAYPQLDIVLLDSLNKRIQFLNRVIEELSLEGILAVHARAEDYAKKERESFDLCVSRAVANLAVLSEYCLPFVKVGGAFVSYKSEKTDAEIEEAAKAIRVLGGEVENVVRMELPDSKAVRNFVVIRKVKETPKKYPRKSGTASKTPIR